MEVIALGILDWRIGSKIYTPNKFMAILRSKDKRMQIVYKRWHKSKPKYPHDEEITISWDDDFLVAGFKDGEVKNTVICGRQEPYKPPPSPPYEWAYNARALVLNKLKEVKF